MDELDAVRLETLFAELEGLQVICAQLVRDNAELRDRLESLTIPTKSIPRAPAPSSGNVMTRRGVMTKALGAAAVTVVGGAALVDREALPAAASNGANVIAGGQTTAEARTEVLYDGAAGFGGVVLLGNDSTYNGTSASFPAGVGGWAGGGATAGKGGVANGVYGFTDNGAGNGVVGVNSGLVAGSGAGVLGTASGAKNAAVQGHNSAGTAVSGTSDSTASDATAIVGLISSSTPGGFSSAMRGQNNGTGGLGIGVWGSHAGSGWGMYATSISGIGLNASGGTGTGVEASGTTAVAANGSTVGVASSGVTAVTANGSTVGVVAKGLTAVSATGVNIGVNASGATAVQAAGTAVGVAAIGPTGVTASGSHDRGGRFRSDGRCCQRHNGWRDSQRPNRCRCHRHHHRGHGVWAYGLGGDWRGRWCVGERSYRHCCNRDRSAREGDRGRCRKQGGHRCGEKHRHRASTQGDDGIWQRRRPAPGALWAIATMGPACWA